MKHSPGNVRVSKTRQEVERSSSIASGASSQYSSKELSEKTWPDFERLFRKKGFVGDGWWCWCTFHHISSFSLPENQQPPTRAERAKLNREKKKKLVATGCAHGILVYAKEEPVGCCQFGPKEELPRMDNTAKYRKLALENDSKRIWRITCFVVDSGYRRRGVASFGLRAALKAIKKKGGGIVEAYPVRKTDQGANYIYCGTVSMFEKAGFKTIAPLAQGRTSTVVMRKTV